MIKWNEFDVFVTVTGLSYYPQARRVFKGERIDLRRERQNKYDKSAFSAYLPEGQIGYVANTEKTLRPNTMSAAKLSELIDDFAVAEVMEASYYDVLCKVDGIFDIDKMVLKAFELYDKMEYTDALKLFLKIGEKYSAVVLLQYTADCLIKLDRYEETLNLLERALDEEPENNISLMMYGTAIEKLGRLEEAADIYTTILAKTDNDEVKKALKRCKSMI